MDTRIAELAQKYRPLAEQILREAIRVPHDFVDRPVEDGGDPLCGTSNHEGPRLEYLKQQIVEIGAVERPGDVFYDEFGNLVWTVEDRDDGIPDNKKSVIWFDGHTDTVMALRPRWHEAIGGVDPYLGVTDPAQVNKGFLNDELGYLPSENEWENLVWGRGSADQLAGVVSQIIATKILLETKEMGSLRGTVVRSYGTVAEEDNDGGSIMYVLRKELPAAGSERIPDAVILTEGTGCANLGACGIYRGQRGRMQIEVEVLGKSCHGSMPWEGRNPLEFGARIIAEASDRYNDGKGIGDDAFLGKGTRTASWAVLDTPSDCAVPEKFVFRFDRRLTAGEQPEDALADVENMASVTNAREHGLKVEIRAPFYNRKSWRGTQGGNPQVYPGWVTPENHPAVSAAVDAYRRVASPHIQGGGKAGELRKEPRVARWIFSTDGVGYPMPVDNSHLDVPASKRWITEGGFHHPAMIGIGPGMEQNTHKIGECVDGREFPVVVGVMARFPSLFHATR